MATRVLETKRNAQEKAVDAIESTKAALFRYSRLVNDYPEPELKKQYAKFQSDFNKLNTKLNDCFGSTDLSSRLLMTVLFWRKSVSTHDARIRMQKLQGRIISASADVEAKRHTQMEEVRAAYKLDLDRKLLQLYSRKEPGISIMEFIANTVRPTAALVFPPDEVDFYERKFYFEVSKFKQNANIGSEDSLTLDGGSDPEAGSSTADDSTTPTQSAFPTTTPTQSTFATSSSWAMASEVTLCMDTVDKGKAPMRGV